MMRKIVPVLSVAALALTAACGKTSAPLTPVTPTAAATTPADGSTLKVSAPGVASPTGNAKMTSSTVVLTATAATAQFATGATFQYRFQVFSAANVMVDQALVNSLTWQVTVQLPGSAVFTWRVRAENASGVGPWSANGSFVSADPFLINDPLTNGTTVGTLVGGHLVPGRGWQAAGVDTGLDYDLPPGKPCSSCTLDFDVTGFGKGEGSCCAKDLKWISMGDARDFNDFTVFRDSAWKMHLEQRADGNGTGLKDTFRNGKAGDSNPGDHVFKIDSTGINFSDSKITHITIRWDAGGFTMALDGVVYIQDSFGGIPYAPPNMRISLGCYPRGETMPNAIWSNVTLKQN